MVGLALFALVFTFDGWFRFGSDRRPAVSSFAAAFAKTLNGAGFKAGCVMPNIFTPWNGLIQRMVILRSLAWIFSFAFSLRKQR